MDYRNFVDNRPFSSKSAPGTSKQDRCLTCYDAGNCLSFIFNPKRLHCNYYTATTKAEGGGENDVRPLGVNKGSYEEMPAYPVLLKNRAGHNYGPCLADAPLGSDMALVREAPAQALARREVLASISTSNPQQQLLEL